MEGCDWNTGSVVAGVNTGSFVVGMVKEDSVCEGAEKGDVG